ncbi:hypothetical protein CMQ_672 [Grosmannia clavigera kw1407]|uniref:Uncharacterized protein n=1 Tax=Grosmannia clavigera (strain kw1407 / UAMH 11150) TaxID=655863 RepID=F0XBW9_GROCL|nr:uncharacterized protein CMQ_672 [Grosmannia clavigera kw1407]EFX03744.1 hypothetical protein CMQ_672 [Grosmannia clavigera kw1407]
MQIVQANGPIPYANGIYFGPNDPNPVEYRQPEPQESVPPVRGGFVDSEDEGVWPFPENMQEDPGPENHHEMLMETCIIVVTQLSRHAGIIELRDYLLWGAGGRRKLREAIRHSRPDENSHIQRAYMIFWTREDAAAAVSRLDKDVFHGLSVEARFTVETVPPWPTGAENNAPAN